MQSQTTFPDVVVGLPKVRAVGIIGTTNGCLSCRVPDVAKRGSYGNMEAELQHRHRSPYAKAWLVHACLVNI